MPRPATASTACFLDDLFVDPEIPRRPRRRPSDHGDGRTLARRQRGWTTHPLAHRRRQLPRPAPVYDRLATRTMWITYQMDL